MEYREFYNMQLSSKAIGIWGTYIAPDLSCRSGIILWCSVLYLRYRTGKSGLSVKCLLIERIVSISVSLEAKLRGDDDSTCFLDWNGEWVHSSRFIIYFVCVFKVVCCVFLLYYLQIRDKPFA